MKSNSKCRTLWCVLLSAATFGGLGADLSAASDAGSAQADMPTVASDAPAFLSRIAVILPEKTKLAQRSWPSETYLQLSSSSDVAWSLKINATLLNRTARVGVGSDNDKAQADVQRAANADAVLIGDDSSWQLKRLTAAGTLATLGVAPAGEADSATSAMRAILGYDAVVIGQDGMTVTAQAPSLAAIQAATRTSGVGMYAVSLENSAAKLVTPASDRTPKSALLQLLTSVGQIATFQVISATAATPLAAGTKLRFEERALSAPERLPAPE